jgi:hypothetical protein
MLLIATIFHLSVTCVLTLVSSSVYNCDLEKLRDILVQSHKVKSGEAEIGFKAQVLLILLSYSQTLHHGG